MTEIPLYPLKKKNLSEAAKEALSQYIDKMLKSGNTKLPPEVELAKILSVSRTTIRRALSDLESKGVIIRIHGKGTFINPNLRQIKLELGNGYDYSKIIKKNGYKPSVKVIYRDICDASPFQESVLEIKENTQLLNLGKLYFADSVPILFCIDYVPVSVLDPVLLTDEQLCTSIYELIRTHSGIICTQDSIELTTSNGHDVMAYTTGEDIMHCNSVLIIDAVNYDKKNRPVFISKTFFNTAYIKFNMSRPIKPGNW